MATKKKRARGTAGAAKKKPERTALPGGAPLRAAPPGKSRARAKQPSKKPAKAKAPKKALKPKAPCKYGPRLASGRCPTKPKKAKALQRDVGALVRPGTTGAERKASAVRVADVVATEVAKQTTMALRRELKKSGVQQQIIAAAKKAAPLVAGISLPLAGGAAIGVARYQLAKRRRETDQSPEGKALRALEEVERSLKRKLTPAERRTLFSQHVQYFKTHR